MRLIDADALIRFIDCGHLRPPDEKCFSDVDMVRMLEKQMEISANPVCHARWEKDESYPIYDDGRFVGYYLVCSECGEAIYDDHGPYNYCPNCGAKMDGKDGDNGV